MNHENPLSAVTARDPYPYYARLVAEREVYWDRDIKMWVASSASAVESILRDPALHVRPPSEPIPPALFGSPAGDIFGRFARMTDGSYHVHMKAALTAAFHSSEALRGFDTLARRCADDLLRKTSLDDPEGLNRFVLGLAPFVTATELGCSASDALQIAAIASTFVRSISPVGTPVDAAVSARASTELIAIFRTMLESRSDGGTLFARLNSAAREYDICDDAVVANAIGLIFQSYDATAGLIGNTLIACARYAAGCPAPGEDFIAEVARYDAPVQNTRRFAVMPTSILGTVVAPGETVLAVLAAANRDSVANIDPDRFDPQRANRRKYTFGLETHACPGSRMAIEVTRAGVAALLDAGIDSARFAAAPTYRSSHNARVPDFSVLPCV